MDDLSIIDLFWKRDPNAIEETASKYNAYCLAVARNLLSSPEDAEECVNDTWMRAWNAIPPQRPRNLPVFLGTITRNLALNRCRSQHAQKRSGELENILQEISQWAAGSPEDALEQKLTSASINSFLKKLSNRKRSIFVCRYWFGDSIEAIAANFYMTPAAVTMQLKRMREKLRTHLEESGVTL